MAAQLQVRIGVITVGSDRANRVVERERRSTRVLEPEADRCETGAEDAVHTGCADADRAEWSLSDAARAALAISSAEVGYLREVAARLTRVRGGEARWRIVASIP